MRTRFVFCAVLLGIASLPFVGVAANGQTTFETKCLGSCHAAGSIAPDQLTGDQWDSLILGGEHEIFSELPLDDAEKKAVVEFLKANSLDAQRESKGIGEWN
jgi:hypothetical protein